MRHLINTAFSVVALFFIVRAFMAREPQQPGIDRQPSDTINGPGVQVLPYRLAMPQWGPRR